MDDTDYIYTLKLFFDYIRIKSSVENNNIFIRALFGEYCHLQDLKDLICGAKYIPLDVTRGRLANNIVHVEVIDTIFVWCDFTRRQCFTAPSYVEKIVDIFLPNEREMLSLNGLLMLIRYVRQPIIRCSKSRLEYILRIIIEILTNFRHEYISLESIADLIAGADYIPMNVSEYRQKYGRGKVTMQFESNLYEIIWLFGNKQIAVGKIWAPMSELQQLVI